MNTSTQVCNLALLRIGNTEFIDALNEATTQAAVCSQIYEHAREVALTRFPWVWATKRATLAVVDGETRSGWLYVYAVPSDCLRPLEIWSGARAPARDQRIPFWVERGASASRVILCDVEDAELSYLVNVEDVAEFPALFADALSWLVAADLALALPGKSGLASGALSAYEAALARARASDLAQRQEDMVPDAEAIRVR